MHFSITPVSLVVQKGISLAQRGTVIILTWLRGYRDHEGGTSRVRPGHCTTTWLTLAIIPNVDNSGVKFLIVGNCVRAIPWTKWKTYKCVY